MAQFFISYASEDEVKAREICALLASMGATYWMAPDSIDPGEDYTEAIPKAIRDCDLFLLLFSQSSDESKDVRKEVTIADRCDKRLVPLRLSAYEPRRLEYHLVNPQWIEWHTPAGEPRLRTLAAQIVRPAPAPAEPVGQFVAAAPGAPQPPAPTRPRRRPNAVFVKGMTCDLTLKQRVEQAEAADQADQSRLHLPGDGDYWVAIPADPREPGSAAFRIGKFPVTVWEYGQYLRDAGVKHEPGDWDWQDQSAHPGRPVTYVSWHDARNYCAWASRKWSIQCDLPTEQQWEFAARGTEGRFYPWGPELEEPDERRANFGGNAGAPSPVGLFPEGDTPEGISDMAGNVLEWTLSDYNAKSKVLRGGCWDDYSENLSAAYRANDEPDVRYDLIGFRVVREA